MSDSLQTHGLYSQPGSSVHGILQERIQEQVAISFFRGSSWPRDRTHISYTSCNAGRFFPTMTTWEVSCHILGHWLSLTAFLTSLIRKCTYPLNHLYHLKFYVYLSYYFLTPCSKHHLSTELKRFMILFGCSSKLFS